MFRIKELRERIFFTVIMLAIFRLGSILTLPGIDPHALTTFFKSQVQGNAFVDYMDFFAGGAFSNFAVFMLGVTPYISTGALQVATAIKLLDGETNKVGFASACKAMGHRYLLGFLEQRGLARATVTQL